MNQTSTLSMDTLSLQTIEVLKEAGQRILGSSLRPSQIEKKGDRNYVTEIDVQIQRFICDELVKILPDSNIIAEESHHNLFTMDKPSWVLDPIDGTTNFIHDLKISVISLALYIDKEPTYGFIYNPYLDELFYARKGHGAWLNGHPVTVTKRSRLAECLIGFGTTPYDRREAERTFEIAYKLFMKSLEVRRSGSAALDLAYVAAGRYDAFFEMELQPWDYAAGLLILREAGGISSNWQGESPDQLIPTSILAANPLIHPELLAIIQACASNQD